MYKCSYCNKEIPKGKGKMFVKNDGSIFYFCSKKCEAHFLRRIRKVQPKWTR
ncbi:MAG: 50S ribosomal protein L24e [Candidatus Aenigmarchaeota archaeon]|nr:50S ribosomal protein L24e [Candidatus Aenigmarchaeota archaeon]